MLPLVWCRHQLPTLFKLCGAYLCLIKSTRSDIKPTALYGEGPEFHHEQDATHNWDWPFAENITINSNMANPSVHRAYHWEECDMSELDKSMMSPTNVKWGISYYQHHTNGSAEIFLRHIHMDGIQVESNNSGSAQLPTVPSPWVRSIDTSWTFTWSYARGWPIIWSTHRHPYTSQSRADVCWMDGSNPAAML